LKTNKEVVVAFINAINVKDWDKVLCLVYKDFVRYSSSTPHKIKSNIGIVNFHKQELEIFPDIHESILLIIEEKDLVAARIRFSGTQLGNLGRYPPTGKRLTADYNCFFRVKRGKIKESWVEYDNLNGLIQLGHYKLSESFE